MHRCGRCDASACERSTSAGPHRPAQLRSSPKHVFGCSDPSHRVSLQTGSRASAAMASGSPGDDGRRVSSEAAVFPAASRVSTVAPLPRPAGESPPGPLVRTASVVSVTWEACAGDSDGEAGLIGSLVLDASGATSTVTVRSPLGLIDAAHLNVVRELGACLAGRTRTLGQQQRRGRMARQLCPHASRLTRWPPAGRGCFGVVELAEWRPEAPRAGQARAPYRRSTAQPHP